jgi:DNA-binding FadR family transcriptional regulator
MIHPTERAVTASISAAMALGPAAMPGKLAWQVARCLAEGIIAAGWPVGRRLGTEAALMRALGVSREPFREGVRLLELQGIVRMTRGPRGGLLVTAPALDVVSSLIRGYLELSDISFREVIDARRIIERRAVALAIENMAAPTAQNLSASLQQAHAARYDRRTRSARYFDVLRTLERIAADPCLAIFDEALHRITIDFGLHERLPGELWTEYSERGFRSLQQMVEAVLAGDVGAGQAAIDTLLSRIDEYVHRLDDAEVGLWTTRSFITGAYLSAGKLLSGSDKAGLKLAYRITAQLRRQALPVGSLIGSEPDMLLRFGVSRAVFREAVRMLEFFGVVEVRRGKEGGLTVAGMNPAGTVGSAMLYLSYAGIRPRQAAGLLELIRAPSGGQHHLANPALELFAQVLEAHAGLAATPSGRESTLSHPGR